MSKLNMEYAPQYVRIREDLRSKILSNELKRNQKIPTEYKLSEKYGVSRNTVIHAIQDLVGEGILVRKRPVGTFVSETTNNSSLKSNNIIGLFFNTQGHTFGSMYQHMLNNFYQHNYLPFIADPIIAETNPKKAENWFRQMMTMETKSLIVDGYSHFPFDLLIESIGSVNNIVFAIHYERSTMFEKANYVLSDYYHGGRIGAAHLLEQGCKSVVVVTFKPQKEEHFFIHSFLSGCRDVVIESGLPPEALKVVDDVATASPNTKERIVELLKGKKAKTGFFAVEDSRAKHIYDAAHQLGMRIPDDIGIVGYYNTPWCDIYEPSLTSVSIREEIIADHVCHIVNKDLSGQYLMVKPELVLRNSCGAVR